MDALLQIASVLAQLATVVTLIFLYRQIEIGRNATRGSLINELEKEFADYYSVFVKLKPGGEWHDLQELSHEDIGKLENLAAFCEKLKHLIDCDVIELKMLDRIFRNRFFLIVQNPNVIKNVIEPYQEDWIALLDLQKSWSRMLPIEDNRCIATVKPQLPHELINNTIQGDQSDV